MIFYEMGVTYFGYAVFLLMSLRLPVAWFDGRIFLRALRTMGYPHPLWFTFQRAVMPSILGAPVILWMTPGDFFRRTPAPALWEMAEQMINAFGDEPDIPSDNNCN